jgi:uncharacterized protein (TIGR03083 family)
VTAGTRPAVPVDEAYRAVLRTTTKLLAGRGEAAGTDIPATPGWTVRDVVQHVVVISYDVLTQLAGEPPALPRPDGTSVADLLATWAQTGDALAGRLPQRPARDAALLVMDAYTHEQDVRTTLGVALPDDHPAYAGSLDLLAQGFLLAAKKAGAAALRIETDDGRSWTTRDEPATATVSGHPYDVYRSLAGRRTPEQIAALRWSEPAQPWLPAFEWGPFHPPRLAIEQPVVR